MMGTFLPVIKADLPAKDKFTLAMPVLSSSYNWGNSKIYEREDNSEIYSSSSLNGMVMN